MSAFQIIVVVCLIMTTFNILLIALGMFLYAGALWTISSDNDPANRYYDRLNRELDERDRPFTRDVSTSGERDKPDPWDDERNYK